jgi:hypothetical protein
MSYLFYKYKVLSYKVNKNQRIYIKFYRNY